MRRAVIFLLALFSLPAPVRAQGWIEPPPRIADAGVVKLRTVVNVRVSGRVARVEVEEWFRNDGGAFGEGDYLYPLPGEAVFSNFSLFQGDQELRGETMNAEEARRIYEEIVRQKKDPALIELAGHGLLRARVFPFSAGETRKITLRYTQVLGRAGDALHFRYAAGTPTQPGMLARRPRERGALPVPQVAPLAFTLVADSAAQFRDAFSPTHRVRVERSDGRMIVRPEGEPRGSFAIFLPLARGLVGTTVVTHRPAGEDGYFMLTLSPPRVTGAAVPRDVSVVLDVSGSMAGDKMRQAREAIGVLLGTLAPSDRFRLITFSSGVASFGPDWSRATPAEVQRARRWIERIVPEGGTNISAALDEAFRATTTEERLPIVVFITDGLPTAGETDAERIAQRAEQERGRARVFAFGVGYDVNTHLLDRLGTAGRGTTQYVEPGESVETELALLAAKIRHPVLTDLRIDGAPVRLTEIFPERLPDLFAGEELIVLGRYTPGAGANRGNVRLSGRRNGAAEAFVAGAAFPTHELENDYVARLWASRKLVSLERNARLSGAHPELVEEIRRLALRYGLLSEYTAYLVQEPGMVAQDAAGTLRRQAGRPAAPPPAAATGASAVMASEAQRERHEAKSLADMNPVEESAAARAGNAGGARRLAGRAFRAEGGEWVDVRHTSSRRTWHVTPFSDAYFALLRVAPELRPYAREFDQVVIAGERLSIRIAPGGAAQVTESELQRLLRDFRGS